jgi:hypothetical protein
MHGTFLRIFLIMAAVSLLFDWYVFSGLKTFVADWKSTLLRRLVTFGYLLASIGVSVVFLAGLSSFGNARGMTPFHEWMLSLFLTFLITKIFFVLVMFFGDIWRFFYGVISYFTKPKTAVDKPFFPARRKFISEAAILVAAFPFTGLLYGRPCKSPKKRPVCFYRRLGKQCSLGD